MNLCVRTYWNKWTTETHQRFGNCFQRKRYEWSRFRSTETRERIRTLINRLISDKCLQEKSSTRWHFLFRNSKSFDAKGLRNENKSQNRMKFSLFLFGLDSRDNRRRAKRRSWFHFSRTRRNRQFRWRSTRIGSFWRRFYLKIWKEFFQTSKHLFPDFIANDFFDLFFVQ